MPETYDTVEVLDPSGTIRVVPVQSLQTALSMGGFYAGSGKKPSFAMPDGEIVGGTLDEAPDIVRRGGRLVPSVSVNFLDPAGRERVVPMSDVDRAFSMGGQLVVKPSRRSDPGQPLSDTGDSRPLEPKTWKTAFSEFFGSGMLSAIPFLNALELVDTLESLALVSKANKGVPMTSREKEKLKAYTADLSRPTTWGYKMWDQVFRLPAYSLEFLASGALVKKGAESAVRQTLRAAPKEAAEEVAKAAGEVAMLRMPKEALENRAIHSADDFAAHVMGTYASMADDAGGAAAKPSIASAVEKYFQTFTPLDKRMPKVWTADALSRAAIPGADDTTKAAQFFLRDTLADVESAAKAVTEGAAGAWAQAGDAAATHLLKATVEGLGPRQLLGMHRIVDSYYQNALSKELSGEKRDDFMVGLLKAYGDMAIENISEQTGEFLQFLTGPAKSVALSAFKGSFIDRLVQKFPASERENGAKMLYRWLFGDNDTNPGAIARMGWAGVIGELAEEGVGGVLRMATGIVEPGLPTFEDVSAMAVAFILNPLSAIGAIGGTRQRRLYQKVRELYSVKDSVVKKVSDEAVEYLKTLEPDSTREAVEPIVVSKEQVKPMVDLLRSAVGTVAPKAVGQEPGVLSGLRGLRNYLSGARKANETILDEVASVVDSDLVNKLSHPQDETLSDETLERVAAHFVTGRPAALNNKPEQVKILNAIFNDDPYSRYADMGKTSVGRMYAHYAELPEGVTDKVPFARLADVAARRASVRPGDILATQRPKALDKKVFANLVKDNPHLFDGGVVLDDVVVGAMAEKDERGTLQSLGVRKLRRSDMPFGLVANTEASKARLADILAPPGMSQAGRDALVAKFTGIIDELKAMQADVYLAPTQIFATPYSEAMNSVYKPAVVTTGEELLKNGTLAPGMAEHIKPRTSYALSVRRAMTVAKKGAGRSVYLNVGMGNFRLSGLAEDAIEASLYSLLSRVVGQGRTESDYGWGNLDNGNASIVAQARNLVKDSEASAEQVAAAKHIIDIFGGAGGGSETEQQKKARLVETFSKYMTAFGGYSVDSAGRDAYTEAAYADPTVTVFATADISMPTDYLTLMKRGLEVGASQELGVIMKTSPLVEWDFEYAYAHAQSRRPRGAMSEAGLRREHKFVVAPNAAQQAALSSVLDRFAGVEAVKGDPDGMHGYKLLDGGTSEGPTSVMEKDLYYKYRGPTFLDADTAGTARHEMIRRINANVYKLNTPLKMEDMDGLYGDLLKRDTAEGKKFVDAFGPFGVKMMEAEAVDKLAALADKDDNITVYRYGNRIFSETAQMHSNPAVAESYRKPDDESKLSSFKMSVSTARRMFRNYDAQNDNFVFRVPRAAIQKEYILTPTSVNVNDARKQLLKEAEEWRLYIRELLNMYNRDNPKDPWFLLPELVVESNGLAGTIDMLLVKPRENGKHLFWVLDLKTKRYKGDDQIRDIIVLRSLKPSIQTMAYAGMLLNSFPEAKISYLPEIVPAVLGGSPNYPTYQARIPVRQSGVRNTELTRERVDSLGIASKVPGFSGEVDVTAELARLFPGVFTANTLEKLAALQDAPLRTPVPPKAAKPGGGKKSSGRPSRADGDSAPDGVTAGFMPYTGPWLVDEGFDKWDAARKELEPLGFNPEYIRPFDPAKDESFSQWKAELVAQPGGGDLADAINKRLGEEVFLNFMVVAGVYSKNPDGGIKSSQPKEVQDAARAGGTWFISFDLMGAPNDTKVLSYIETKNPDPEVSSVQLIRALYEMFGEGAAENARKSTRKRPADESVEEAGGLGADDTVVRSSRRARPGELDKLKKGKPAGAPKASPLDKYAEASRDYITDKERGIRSIDVFKRDDIPEGMTEDEAYAEVFDDEIAGAIQDGYVWFYRKDGDKDLSKTIPLQYAAYEAELARLGYTLEGYSEDADSFSATVTKIEEDADDAAPRDEDTAEPTPPPPPPPSEPDAPPNDAPEGGAEDSIDYAPPFTVSQVSVPLGAAHAPARVDDITDTAYSAFLKQVLARFQPRVTQEFLELIAVENLEPIVDMLEEDNRVDSEEASDLRLKRFATTNQAMRIFNFFLRAIEGKRFGEALGSGDVVAQQMQQYKDGILYDLSNEDITRQVGDRSNWTEAMNRHFREALERNTKEGHNVSYIVPWMLTRENFTSMITAAGVQGQLVQNALVVTARMMYQKRLETAMRPALRQLERQLQEENQNLSPEDIRQLDAYTVEATRLRALPLYRNPAIDAVRRDIAGILGFIHRTPVLALIEVRTGDDTAAAPSGDVEEFAGTALESGATGLTNSFFYAANSSVDEKYGRNRTFNHVKKFLTGPNIPDIGLGKAPVSERTHWTRVAKAFGLAPEYLNESASEEKKARYQREMEALDNAWNDYLRASAKGKGSSHIVQALAEALRNANQRVAGVVRESGATSMADPTKQARILTAMMWQANRGQYQTERAKKGAPLPLLKVFHTKYLANPDEYSHMYENAEGTKSLSYLNYNRDTSKLRHWIKRVNKGEVDDPRIVIYSGVTSNVKSQYWSTNVKDMAANDLMDLAKRYFDATGRIVVWLPLGDKMYELGVDARPKTSNFEDEYRKLAKVVYNVVWGSPDRQIERGEKGDYDKGNPPDALFKDKADVNKRSQSYVSRGMAFVPMLDIGVAGNVALIVYKENDKDKYFDGTPDAGRPKTSTDSFAYHTINFNERLLTSAGQENIRAGSVKTLIPSTTGLFKWNTRPFSMDELFAPQGLGYDTITARLRETAGVFDQFHIVSEGAVKAYFEKIGDRKFTLNARLMPDLTKPWTEAELRNKAIHIPIDDFIFISSLDHNFDEETRLERRRFPVQGVHNTAVLDDDQTTPKTQIEYANEAMNSMARNWSTLQLASRLAELGMPGIEGGAIRFDTLLTRPLRDADNRVRLRLADAEQSDGVFTVGGLLELGLTRDAARVLQFVPVQELTHKTSALMNATVYAASVGGVIVRPSANMENAALTYIAEHLGDTAEQLIADRVDLEGEDIHSFMANANAYRVVPELPVSTPAGYEALLAAMTNLERTPTALVEQAREYLNNLPNVAESTRSELVASLDNTVSSEPGQTAPRQVRDYMLHMILNDPEIADQYPNMRETVALFGDHAPPVAQSLSRMLSARIHRNFGLSAPGTIALAVPSYAKVAGTEKDAFDALRSAAAGEADPVGEAANGGAFLRKLKNAWRGTWDYREVNGKIRPAIVAIGRTAGVREQDIRVIRAKSKAGALKQTRQWVAEQGVKYFDYYYNDNGVLEPDVHRAESTMWTKTADDRAEMVNTSEWFVDKLASGVYVVIVPGSLGLTDRVPGGPGAHHLVRAGFFYESMSGAVAFDPRLVSRAGVDFDLDKWYMAWATLAADRMSGVGVAHILRTRDMYQKDSFGSEFLMSSIELELIAEKEKPLLEKSRKKHAGEFEYPSGPGSLYDHRTHQVDLGLSQEARRSLGPWVASASAFAEMFNRGTLRLDEAKIVKPLNDGFKSMVEKGSLGVGILVNPGGGFYDVTEFRMRDLAKEPLTKREKLELAQLTGQITNQIIDNLKNPLIHLTGITRELASMIQFLAATTVGQKGDQRMTAVDRLLVLADLFANTDGGIEITKYLRRKVSKIEAAETNGTFIGSIPSEYGYVFLGINKLKEALFGISEVLRVGDRMLDTRKLSEMLGFVVQGAKVKDGKALLPLFALDVNGKEYEKVGEIEVGSHSNAFNRVKQLTTLYKDVSVGTEAYDTVVATLSYHGYAGKDVRRLAANAEAVVQRYHQREVVQRLIDSLETHVQMLSADGSRNTYRQDEFDRMERLLDTRELTPPEAARRRHESEFAYASILSDLVTELYYEPSVTTLEDIETLGKRLLGLMLRRLSIAKLRINGDYYVYGGEARKMGDIAYQRYPTKDAEVLALLGLPANGSVLDLIRPGFAQGSGGKLASYEMPTPRDDFASFVYNRPLSDLDAQAIKDRIASYPRLVQYVLGLHVAMLQGNRSAHTSGSMWNLITWENIVVDASRARTRSMTTGAMRSFKHGLLRVGMAGTMKDAGSLVPAMKPQFLLDPNKKNNFTSLDIVAPVAGFTDAYTYYYNEFYTGPTVDWYQNNGYNRPARKVTKYDSRTPGGTLDDILSDMDRAGGTLLVRHDTNLAYELMKAVGVLKGLYGPEVTQDDRVKYPDAKIPSAEVAAQRLTILRTLFGATDKIAAFPIISAASNHQYARSVGALSSLIDRALTSAGRRAPIIIDIAPTDSLGRDDVLPPRTPSNIADEMTKSAQINVYKIPPALRDRPKGRTAKIMATREHFVRRTVAKDTDTMYLFTDNYNRTSGRLSGLVTPSWYVDEFGWELKDGEEVTKPIHWPGSSQAVIRVLDNAYPITTMYAQGKQWHDNVWTQKEAADRFELFKQTIDDDIARIKANAHKYKNGVVFNNEKRIGQGTFSRLKPAYQEYLDRKLLDIGIDNSGTVPLARNSFEVDPPSYTASQVSRGLSLRDEILLAEEEAASLLPESADWNDAAAMMEKLVKEGKPEDAAEVANNLLREKHVSVATSYGNPAHMLLTAEAVNAAAKQITGWFYAIKPAAIAAAIMKSDAWNYLPDDDVYHVASGGHLIGFHDPGGDLSRLLGELKAPEQDVALQWNGLRRQDFALMLISNPKYFGVARELSEQATAGVLGGGEATELYAERMPSLFTASETTSRHSPYYEYHKALEEFPFVDEVVKRIAQYPRTPREMLEALGKLQTNKKATKEQKEEAAKLMLELKAALTPHVFDEAKAEDYTELLVRLADPSRVNPHFIGAQSEAYGKTMDTFRRFHANSKFMLSWADRFDATWGMETAEDGSLIRFVDGGLPVRSMAGTAIAAVATGSETSVDTTPSGIRFTEAEAATVYDFLNAVGAAMYQFDGTNWNDAVYQKVPIRGGFKLNRETGKFESDPEYLDVSEAIYKFEQSTAREKLLAAGRTQDQLNPRLIALELREIFKDIIEMARQRDNELGAGVIGARENYYPLDGGKYGVRPLDEIERMDQRVKDILDRKKTPTTVVLPQAYKSAFAIHESQLSATSVDPWPAPTSKQLEVLRKLRSDYFTGMRDTTPSSNVVANDKIYQLLHILAGVESEANPMTDEMIELFRYLHWQRWGLRGKLSPTKETSARLKHRRFNTPQELFEASTEWDYPMYPKRLAPGEVVREYAKSHLIAAGNRLIINWGATSVGVDGKPNIVYVPVSNDLEDDAVITEATVRAQVSLLSSAYNAWGHGKPLDALRELVINHVANDPTYKRVPTVKLRSAGEIYARVGEGWHGWGESTYAALSHILAAGFHLEYPPWVRSYAQVVSGDPDALMHRNALQDFLDVIQAIKFSNLGASLFFSFSAVESYLASMNLGEALSDPVGYISSLTELRKQIHSGNIVGWANEATRNLIAAGYTLDIEKKDATILDLSVARRMTKSLDSREGWLKYPGKFMAAVMKRQMAFSRWMFDDLFATLKLHAALGTLQTIESLKAQSGKGPLSHDDYLVVADYMNNAFGGQDWTRFWWANKKALQVMNLSLFAPNWTLSSFRVAGGNKLMEKLGVGPETGDYGTHMQLTRYWPQMVGLTLVSWPLVLQAMIYGAFGDPDEEDMPIPFLNETEREFHVDITPIVRKLPWYDGSPSGDRRFYIRWGKQVYEVFDPNTSWAADALQLKVRTLFRKLSTPARLAVEMTIGPVGSDYSYSFEDMGLLGLVWTDDKGFMGSRIGHALSSLLPYSVSQVMRGSSGFPFSLIGPVSKGASQYKLTEEATKALKTYASDAAWEEIKTNDEARAALEGVMPNIARAAAANGYKPESVIHTARASVLGELYRDMAKALEDENKSRIERLAARILRVNGSLRGLKQSFGSVNRKFFGTPREYTQEQWDMIAEAFGGPDKVPYRKITPEDVK